MTDFYALLKQSILDRGIRSATDREEVYAQARRAVIKQLWDFRPPLAADEIDMRVGAYDKAVERIEADLRVTFASAAPPPKPSRAVVPAKPARKVALEAVRVATYAPNGRGQASAALAEWAREQPEYAPGVQRAAAYEPPPPMDEAANDDYFEEVTYEEEVREPQRRRAEPDRWSEPRRTEPRRITPRLSATAGFRLFVVAGHARSDRAAPAGHRHRRTVHNPRRRRRLPARGTLAAGRDGRHRACGAK